MKASSRADLSRLSGQIFCVDFRSPFEISMSRNNYVVKGILVQENGAMPALRR